MPQPDPTELNAERIIELFQELDALLDGFYTEVLVMGGAALVVYWAEQGTPRHRATFDVDAVSVTENDPGRGTFGIAISPPRFPDHLKDAIDKLTNTHTVASDWFNHDAGGVLDDRFDFEQEVLFQGKNLTVYRPSPRAQLE